MATPSSLGTDSLPPNSFAMPRIPRYVLQTSPVSMSLPDSDAGSRAVGLPLNLIALIVSYLDDLADIARVTRTSRLLYYMTLPRLYERVSLHSYSEVRYVGGRPEGFGSGSPFSMALNGFVTKQYAQLVKAFRIWGSWKEVDAEEFAKGRVPDNSMMLNTLLRVSIDKMMKLESFSWELDCKPLKTLYHGLSSRNTLTSLTLKFPSKRQPRPAVLIPPIPSLRVLRATDIDPLCYPDDLSLLLLQSKKLQDLRLHFSPRMRDEAESSLSLDTYFKRCFLAKYTLPLKHFAMQNFFGSNSKELGEIFDPETIYSICFIDTFGGARGSPANVFLDDTWRDLEPHYHPNFKVVRCNEMATQHVSLIKNSVGMEEFYFINACRRISAEATPDGQPSPVTPGNAEYDVVSLGKDYLFALTRSHGMTLRRLLLSDKWALTTDELGDLIRFCPNLEQLGLAIDTAEHRTLRLLVPFLPKLTAIRILNNDWLCQHFKIVSHEQRLTGMQRDLWKTGCEHIKWIGIGDEVFKAGEVYQGYDASGQLEMRREVVSVSQEEVQDIDIWGMDKLEI